MPQFGSATRQPNGQSPGVPSGSPTSSGFYGVSESGNTVTRDLQSAAGRAGARTAQSNLPDEFNPGSSLRTSQIAQRGIERLDQASLQAMSLMSPSYREHLNRRGPDVLDVLMRRKDISSMAIAKNMIEKLGNEGIDIRQGQVMLDDKAFQRDMDQQENLRRNLETQLHAAAFVRAGEKPEKPSPLTVLPVSDRSKFTPRVLAAYDNAVATGHPQPWVFLNEGTKGPDGVRALNNYMRRVQIDSSTPESRNDAMLNADENGVPDYSRLVIGVGKASPEVEAAQEEKRQQYQDKRLDRKLSMHDRLTSSYDKAAASGEPDQVKAAKDRLDAFEKANPDVVEYMGLGGVGGAGAGAVTGAGAVASAAPAAARPAPVQVSPDSITWARQNVNSPNKTWADAAMKIMQQSGVAGATATPATAPAAAPATSASSTTPTAPFASPAAPASPATPSTPNPGSIEEYYRQRHEDYTNFLKDQETKAKATNDNSAQAYFKQKNDEHRQFLNDRESKANTAATVASTTAAQQRGEAPKETRSGDVVKTFNNLLATLRSPASTAKPTTPMGSSGKSLPVPHLIPINEQKVRTKAAVMQESGKLPDFLDTVQSIGQRLRGKNVVIARVPVDGKMRGMTWTDLKDFYRKELTPEELKSMTEKEIDAKVAQWLSSGTSDTGSVQ